MIVALFLFVLTIATSFLFSGFETGFISWNHYKIEKRAHEGELRARWGLLLQDNRAKVLTTVLVGNNIALVIMENSFSFMVSSFLPSLVQSLTLTIFVVIFCELLPKSLFRIYSFNLTYMALPFMMFFYYITYPFSWAFEQMSKIVSPKKTSNAVNGSAFALAYEGSKHETLPPLLVPLLTTASSAVLLKEWCVSGKIMPTSHVGVVVRVQYSMTLQQMIHEKLLFTTNFIQFEDEVEVYRTIDILDALFT